MRHIVYFVILAWLALARAGTHSENDLKKYINGDYEIQASDMCTKSMQASWNYETDITDDHSAKVTEAALENAKFAKSVYTEWFKDVVEAEVKDASIKRMLKDLKQQGSAALSDEDLKKLTDTISAMTKIYSSAKICPYEKKDSCKEDEKLNLEPEIEKIFSESTDYDELQYVWEAWHEASGKKMRTDFKTYVDLSNKVGTLNDFPDAGAYWRDSFETKDFVEQVDKIWDQVEPLYKALHSYASDKLKVKFGSKLVIDDDGLLPAHIFGNMWAQSWMNLDKLLKPFPSESEVDITKALIEKKYTEKKIFETSNEFYTSLGLPTNEGSYGPLSMITRPTDREVTCHASAWDFCNKKDFLIKMCTEVNHEDFVTVHHEMGHIQYFILYKDQPIAFRAGANPGFHEAVGDTIALSVQSIPHLQAIDLVKKEYQNTAEASINTLMSMALEKIAFLPFGLLIDKWRWDVFSGETTQANWNKHWWDLRKKYQLVKPPTERGEEFFDPGAKFHVAADSQYISYFVSHILQFQFYRGLCIAAGKYDPATKNPPLHECDFYKSKKAGDLLKDALSLGSSKPWPEVLKIIAGTDKLDACALLEYFNPLRKHFGLEGDVSCDEKEKDEEDEDDKDDTGRAANLPIPSILFLVVGVFVQYLY